MDLEASNRDQPPAARRLRVDAACLDAIVDSALDAIITVDAAHRIVLFNAAAEAMFRCNADDTIGTTLDRFIPHDLLALPRARVEDFPSTEATVRQSGQQWVLHGLRADGSEFPVEASISQVVVGDQRLLTVVLRDITARVSSAADMHQAQERLREGEVRLEAILRSAMDAIITADDAQRIVLFNAAAEKMFGCPAAEAIGTLLDRFIPQRFRNAHRVHMERFGQTGETARRMGRQTALAALRVDGTEFPIEASISHATVGGQRLSTVILRDITARVHAERQIQRAHDELRELAVAMQEVRETERTRIARELHDELGQALTALKMDVDLLESTLPGERTDLLERIEAMRELLDFTVATTRRISAALRPLVLDDLGLGAAAEWLMQNVVQRAGLAWRLRIDPACAELGEPQASALFRILQESLTNVTRHAHATKVEVELERSDTDAILRVRDDGVGIDPAAPPKPGSFGLRGISERVLLLGGSVVISGQPGQGTTIEARVPLGAPSLEGTR
jgi:PAS domain S-box-containing protein